MRALRPYLIGCVFIAVAFAIGVLLFASRGAFVMALSQSFSPVQINPEVIARHDIARGSVVKPADVEVGYFPNLKDFDAFHSVESVVGRIAPRDIRRGEHLHESEFNRPPSYKSID